MAILLSEQIRQRKQQKRLTEANERHARGDIDGELLSRMTKPKQAEAMHQVYVDIAGEAGSMAASPKFFGEAGAEAATRIVEALNANICLGRLKGWGNVRVETANHVPAH